jgi:type IV pilus assembly protein PilM
MSSANPIIVNCGATHVSLSVFSASGGQLKLEKFFVQSLTYNYANEDEWLLALASTLKRIVDNTRLSGPATVIVPGYRLLTKNIKVPQVERARQRQMIAFEAQNSLPDAHEMVWDSQIIATDGVEAEVVLFAHKTVDATLFTEAICSTGLKPVVVGAATLLDYQAYKLTRRAQAEEEVLLVNIGARSTNLTFVSPGGFSIQNISLGGNWLTQMLADHLGERFSVAEELKINYFLGQVQANPGDPLQAALDAQSQAFTKRLAQDISRRIINYKRNNQNRTPVRLLLTGRASLLPGLKESLAESLKIETEFFEPVSALQIGPQVRSGLFESVNRFQMSEAVGEAARLVLKDAVGVNLLPPEIAGRMEFAKKKPVLVLAALLFAAAPLPVAWHFWTKNAVLAKDVKTVLNEYHEYNENLNGLRPKKDYKGNLELDNSGNIIFEKAEGIQSVDAKSKQLVSRVEAMTQIAVAKTSWSDLLRELQKAILLDSGKHAWIESLSIQRPEKAPPPPPATTAAARAAAAAAAKAAKAAPPAPYKITLTIRALLPDVNPGSDYSADKDNACFTDIAKALESCSSVQKVEASSAEQSPNLPRRTFILTINPETYL